MSEKGKPPAAMDTASPAPLARALDQSEQVKTKVEECVADLSLVNGVLRQEVAEGAMLPLVEQTLDTSERVEAKVQECVDELATINDVLAEEIDERHLLEHQLSTSDSALVQSRVQERKARHLALHDAVTGLPNMTLFRDRLETALIQAARHHWRLAVMFIDLDKFKTINDTHGHDVGDLVLQTVGQRLEQSVRGGDTVSRRSGDEFLLVMLEPRDAAAVVELAQKIEGNVASPCDLRGVQLRVTSSIGIALYPEDGESAGELLRKADLAMYAAKQRGQGAMLYSQMPIDSGKVEPANTGVSLGSA